MYVSRQCLLLLAASGHTSLTSMAEAVLLSNKKFKTHKESQEEKEAAELHSQVFRPPYRDEEDAAFGHSSGHFALNFL